MEAANRRHFCIGCGFEGRAPGTGKLLSDPDPDSVATPFRSIQFGDYVATGFIANANGRNTSNLPTVEIAEPTRLLSNQVRFR